MKGDSKEIRPMKSVMELSGALHRYAVGKTTDWDMIREETMRIVAEEIAGEMQETEEDANQHHD